MKSGVHLMAMGKTVLSLEIDDTLLHDARRRGVTLEVAFEDGIRLALARRRLALTTGVESPQVAPEPLPGDVEARAMRWSEENAAAIEAYRRRIDEFGAFAEDLPRW